MTMRLKNLEEILLEDRLASELDLQRAHRGRKPGQSLVSSLIEMGEIGSRRLARVLARAYCLPFQADVDEKAFDKGLLAIIPVNYAAKNRILPFGTDGASIVVAIADPSNFCALDDIGLMFRLPVHPVVVPFDVLDHVIARAYDGVCNDTATPTCAQGRIVVLEKCHLDDAARELFQAEPAETEGDAPLVRFVNALLWEATRNAVTEIQIEPCERDWLAVRFQAKTERYKEMSAPKRFEGAIISRIKTMAMLNLSDRSLPQDGHIRLRVAGRVIAVRVSVTPGEFGERTVLGFDGGPEQRLLSVVEDFAEAVSGLTKKGDEAPNVPVCPDCGESIVVIGAVFCKECGGRVRDTPSGSAKTEVMPRDVAASQARTLVSESRGSAFSARSSSPWMPVLGK